MVTSLFATDKGTMSWKALIKDLNDYKTAKGNPPTELFAKMIVS